MSSVDSDEGTRELPPVPLTVDLLRELTGEQDLLAMQSVELAFEPLNDISLLTQCTQLQQITLISNTLDDFPRQFSFGSLGSVLQVLCIASQHLSRMNFLGKLPHLRELYLYDNSIEEISGLEGCPSLQKLWLHNNCISAIDGLHVLSDLRELWLQNNEISSCDGLRPLVNLQVLNLSGNQLTELVDLEPLSSLATLFDLGLADPHFPPCPVAKREGYRSFIIQYLKGVRILDGTLVGEDERNRMEDNYLQTVLDYSDKMDELKRSSDAQMSAIEHQIRGFQERGRLMSESFSSALRSLEGSIAEGRSAIQAQHLRLSRRYASALRTFKASCEDIRKAYEEEVAYCVRREKERVRSEEIYYRRACRAVEALKRWFITLYALHGSRCIEISDKSPEMKMFATLSSNASTGAGSAVSNQAARVPVRLFRGFRLLPSATAGVGSRQSRVVGPSSTPSSIIAAANHQPSVFIERVFLAVTLSQMEAVFADSFTLERGLDFVNPSEPCLVFRDLASAIVHAQSSDHSVESESVIAVLICLLTHPSNTARIREHGEVAVSNISPAYLRSQSGDPSFDMVLFGGRDSTAKILVAQGDLLAPDMLLLYAPLRALFSGADFEAMEVDVLRTAWSSFTAASSLQSRSGHGNEKLLELERRLMGDYVGFLRQVWDEVWDERAAKEMRAREDEMIALQAQLAVLDSEVEAERLEQQRLIKSYRHEVYQTHPTHGLSGPAPPLHPLHATTASSSSSASSAPSSSSQASGGAASTSATGGTQSSHQPGPANTTSSVSAQSAGPPPSRGAARPQSKAASRR
jgi:hypothetical protein